MQFISKFQCDLYLRGGSISAVHKEDFIRGHFRTESTNTTGGILYNEATEQDFISNLYLALEPLEKYQELAVIFSTNIDSIQALSISLPCGQRNLTDTFTTVNSINTNLKNKSNVVDINVKNLNIKDSNITDELRDIIKTNIVNSLPKSAAINDVNIVNYK